MKTLVSANRSDKNLPSSADCTQDVSQLIIDVIEDKSGGIKSLRMKCPDKTLANNFSGLKLLANVSN
jgi:hypothetical protein